MVDKQSELMSDLLFTVHQHGEHGNVLGWLLSEVSGICTTRMSRRLLSRRYITGDREFWRRLSRFCHEKRAPKGRENSSPLHSRHDFAAPLPTLSSRGRSRRLRRLFKWGQAFVFCCALHDSHAQGKVLEALSQTVTGLVL